MDERNSRNESLQTSAAKDSRTAPKATFKMKHLCLHEYKQAALKQGNNFFSGWICHKCGKLAETPRHVVGYDSSEA